jgi:hypothetical protein
MVEKKNLYRKLSLVSDRWNPKIEGELNERKRRCLLIFRETPLASPRRDKPVDVQPQA